MILNLQVTILLLVIPDDKVIIVQLLLRMYTIFYLTIPNFGGDLLRQFFGFFQLLYFCYFLLHKASLFQTIFLFEDSFFHSDIYTDDTGFVQRSTRETDDSTRGSGHSGIFRFSGSGETGSNR